MPEHGNEHSEEIQLDLLELLMVYLHRWWAIALSVIVTAAIALGVTWFAITPQYTASVSLYVNNSRTSDTTEITSTSLSTSKMLVGTYMNMVKSNTVLQKVVDTAGLEYSVGQLRSMLSTSQMDDTEIFRISITHPDPEEAAAVVNAIADIAPGELENFIVGSSCKIIDFATVPSAPSSPSYSRNTILGGLVGGVIMVGILTVMHLTDVRIKTAEDLTKLFDMPVLGEIPDFSAKHKEKQSGKWLKKSTRMKN